MTTSREFAVVALRERMVKGKLERASQNHLLFQARMVRQPDITIKYSCRIEDAVKRK